MLTLKVPMDDAWDEANEKFTASRYVTVELEHSLASLAKWERLHEKPFLSEKEKTTVETLSYIREMVLTPDLPIEVFNIMIDKFISEINDYIQAKMTATWFREDPNAKKSREVITAEILYYNMTAMNIPFECQHWHLNSLLTLIKVINLKNEPKKKTNRRDAAAQRRALVQQRRQQYGTRG